MGRFSMRVASVDVGTTNIKGSLIDVDESSGELSVLEAVNVRQVVVGEERGAHEHEPRYVLRTMEEVIAHLVRSYGKPDCVVVSSYLFSVVATRDGEHVTRIITWLDERSREVLDELGPSRDEIYLRSGCPPLPIYALPKVLFLKKRKPELFSGKTKLLDSKSFIMNHLIGYPITDYSTASGTYQLLNVRTLEWDDFLLSLAGVDETLLPEVAEGDHVDRVHPRFANAAGVDEGTPVVLGFYDGGSMIYALSGGRGNVAVVNLGTSGMVRVTHGSPIIDDPGLMRFQTYYLYRGAWIPGGGVSNVGVVLEYMGKLLDVDAQNLPEVASRWSLEKLLTGDRPIVIPLLHPERIPGLDAGLGASIVGLKPDHSREDVLLATMEGVALVLSLLAEAMREKGIRIDEVKLAGKVATLGAMPHIIANVLSATTTIPEVPDVGHAGNALIGLERLEPQLARLARSRMESSPRLTRVTPRRELEELYSRLRERFGRYLRDIYAWHR